jgi:hypothetical protein
MIRSVPTVATITAIAIVASAAMAQKEAST